MSQSHKDIADVLGDRYAAFYNAAVPIDNLTPGQTLSGAVSVANRLLKIYGRDLYTWPSQHTYEIARLVRANWIYQNLSSEPIRKPFLVHRGSRGLAIDCGDTRFMALQAQGNHCTVSAILSCTLDQAHRYSNWSRILTSQDLIDCVRFDKQSARVIYTAAPPNADHAFTWLDVGDNSTSHHLHSVEQRLHMAQRYLQQQNSNFKFDEQWINTKIDWDYYGH